MRRFARGSWERHLWQKRPKKAESYLHYRQSCDGEDAWNKARHSRIERHYGIWLKRTLIRITYGIFRTLIRAKAYYGIYASRREIT